LKVYDFAIKSADPSDAEIVQKKAPRDAASMEYTEWKEALGKAASNIQRKLLRLVAEDFQHTDEWKQKCEKKSPPVDPEMTDPIGELGCSIGSVYSKMTTLDMK